MNFRIKEDYTALITSRYPVALIKSTDNDKNRAIAENFKLSKISHCKLDIEDKKSGLFELMTKESFDAFHESIKARIIFINVDRIVEPVEPTEIKVSTRTPEKWIFIDTETTECYDNDFKYISKERKQALIKMLVESL